MSSNNEVVIVGAGAIGCSIAYQLGLRGVRATVVDRESIGTRASGKAWAIVIYPPAWLVQERLPPDLRGDFTGASGFGTDPGEGDHIARWIDLLWMGYFGIRDLSAAIEEDSGVDVEYAESRSTFLVDDRNDPESARERMLEVAGGVAASGFEWLDAGALKESLPGISQRFVGGLSAPELQIEPYKFTLALAQAAEKHGATFRHGEVVGFGTRGDRVTSVRLASGDELGTDALVLATGPWSTRHAAQLGCELPIENLLDDCIRVRLDEPLPLHTLCHGNAWILPRRNGDVICASWHEGAEVKPPGEFDARLCDESPAKIIRDVTQILPGLERARLIEHRGDLLAYAPPAPCESPVMGRIPGWENAHLATRFGGSGMMLSPGVGELMAELLTQGTVPIPARQLMRALRPAARR